MNDISVPQQYDLETAALKVPPHSIEAEQAVLGGLMLDNNAWERVSDAVSDGDFYRHDHRLIFRAIFTLAERNSPFDVVTLSEQLDKEGHLSQVGGLGYLGELAKNTPSVANIKAYAQIIRERATLRQLIGISNDIADMAYAPQGKSAVEVLDEAERQIFQIAEARPKAGGPVGINEILVKTIDRIDHLFNTSDALTGITTGFKVLDDCLYHKGWGRRELAVLMGGAKAGKSMGMISFGINAIAAGYRTLYVTLEVASEIIAERIDANVAERAMFELGAHIHEVDEKVEAFMAKAAPFIIHEYPTGTMRCSDLRRLIEHYKSQGIIFDFVIVDYADLMAPERATDNVQENSKSIYVNLRGLAMQEGFACLTATQTNREGAKKAVALATDVAEDFNKIRIADVVISINKTEEERALNQARLHFAASRNQRSGFTLKVEQNIDQAKFVTRVLGEE